MANEQHREKEDTQKPATGNHVPKNEAPNEDPAPANQRHSDQGKLQQTYESQKAEGGVRGRDAVPRDESK